MRKFYYVVLLASILHGCGKKEDEESSTASKDIIGTWSVCLQEEDSKGNAVSSVKSTYTFAEDQTCNITLQYYLDTECTEVNKDPYSYDGTYTIGEEMEGGWAPINLIGPGGNEDGSDSVYYQIVKIVDNTLQFGKDTDEFDGSTEEKRPQELNTEYAYSKIE